MDNVDGDITANIVVGGDIVDTNTLGTYIITYDVSDAAGNAATQVTRTVNVIDLADTTPPVITAINPTQGEDLDFTDVIFKVSLNEAGNVTYSLSGEPNVTMNQVSSWVFKSDELELDDEESYTVTFYATDLSGNTASLTITFSIDEVDEDDDDKDDSEAGYYTEDIVDQEPLIPEPTIDLDNQNPKLNWWQRFVNWLCRVFGLEEIY